MATDNDFVLSPEPQCIVLSALNAYLYELRERTGKTNVYGTLIARVEALQATLFEHHYGVPLCQK